MHVISSDLTKWDHRYLELAGTVSSWSRDPSTKVGAVIARGDKTIASVGFNGFPRGVNDAESRYNDRPTKYLMVVHAEANAIINAREPVHGYTMYCTHAPCSSCAAQIIQSGIMCVIAPHPSDEMRERWGDSWIAAETMFAEADVLFYTLKD